MQGQPGQYYQQNPGQSGQLPQNQQAPNGGQYPMYQQNPSQSGQFAAYQQSPGQSGQMPQVQQYPGQAGQAQGQAGYQQYPAQMQGQYPPTYPNSMQYPSPNAGKKKKSKKRAVVVIIIVLVVIAALGALAFWLLSPKPQNGSYGQLEGKTTQEIIDELNKIVEDGMFQVSIASMISFADGTSEGEWKIENSQANHYSMQVEVKLDDTDEVVYTSPVLDPNYHIQFAPLSVDLDEGVYNATAIFYALDMETGAQVGQTSAQVILQVNG